MSKRAPFLTADQVHAAMERLAADGQDPSAVSMGKLRAILGSGSQTTIGKHRATWRQPVPAPSSGPAEPATMGATPRPVITIPRSQLQAMMEKLLPTAQEIKKLRSQLAAQAKRIEDLAIEIEVERNWRVTVKPKGP